MADIFFPENVNHRRDRVSAPVTHVNKYKEAMVCSERGNGLPGKEFELAGQ